MGKEITVYGINGTRAESVKKLEELLDESIILSDSFKEKIMDRVQKVMVECFTIGKNARDNIE